MRALPGAKQQIELLPLEWPRFGASPPVTTVHVEVEERDGEPRLRRFPSTAGGLRGFVPEPR